MKLLIVTQVIDVNHPILGFFHRWVQEFATHCEQVHIICLELGQHHLPDNVTVHSLGKESGTGKLTQLGRFLKYSWQLRREYEAVFVHMIPLYVIIGAPIWRLLRKRIGFWYTHGSVTLLLRVAGILTNQIFTASPESCKLRSRKIHVTGHGIDTDHFRAIEGIVKDIDLITVGRIAKAKNLTTLVDILVAVRKTHDVSLTIVGAAVTPEEQVYDAELRDYIAALGLTDQVHFLGRVCQAELPQTLNRAKVFVTTAQNGSLDKAVLEAMACGLPIVSMAPGTESLPLGGYQTTSSSAFVSALKQLFQSNYLVGVSNEQYITKHHSLTRLVAVIVKLYDQ